MVAVSTAVSVGAPDVLYPRLYVGGTANASAQVLLTDGTAVQGAGVTFLWRAPDQTQVEIAGVWDATGTIWRCAREVDTSGTWAVRMRCATPQRQTDWMLFEVVDAPEADSAPGAAIWLAQSGQPLVTTNGGLLTGVRVTELEPIDTLDRSVAIPGVAGSTDPQVKSTTVGAVADFAKAEAAEAAGSAAAAATSASQAATTASGAATTAAQAATDAGTAKTDATAAALAAATSASHAATAGADAGAAAGTQAAQPYAQAAQTAKDGATAAQTAAESAAATALTSLNGVQGLPAVNDIRAFLTDSAGSVYAEIGLADLVLQFLSLIQSTDGRIFTLAGGNGAVSLDVESDGTLSVTGARIRPDGSFETPYGGIDAATSALTIGNLLMRSLSTAGALTVTDSIGGVVFNVAADGIEAGDAVLGKLKAAFATLNYEPLLNADNLRIAHTDPIGGVIQAVRVDGTFETAEAAPLSYWSSVEIAQRDTAQRAMMQETMRQVVSGIVSAIWDVNAVIGMGQSQSIGVQSGPLLTRAPRMASDLLMWGISVRPLRAANTLDASPWGDNDFHSLVSTMEGTGSLGNGLLTLAEGDQVALATAGPGESAMEGAAHQFRRMQMASRGLASDPARPLVVNALGIGDTNINDHIPGGLIFENRYRKHAVDLKAKADALGKTSGVAAIYFEQGGNDDKQNTSAITGVVTADRSGYAAKLSSIINTYRGAVAQGTFGQREVPGVYLVQTRSMSELAHTTDLGVQMAQLDVAASLPGVYVVAQSYAAPDYGTHYTSQGYRMEGCQIGKVMHWTQVLRRPWLPLIPTSLVRRGREILLSYPVMHPPLVFDRPLGNTGYVASRLDKGFRALDSARNDLGILGAQIVGQTQVLVTLASLPVDGIVNLRFADYSVGGNGFLRDSDPTRAEDVWEFLSGTTQNSAENIAALIGQPYPLWNWALAFHLPVTAA